VTKLRSLLTLAASAAVMFSVAAPAAATAVASGVSPQLERGPRAVKTAVKAKAHGGYGIFSCQLGQSVGQCYDPYQMRHAYGIDSLIADGYTGKGSTILIVDAFQSPNIVSQLNTFDTFYGLPGLNGLGNASDSSLGFFKQIAPDGLTPFDQTDPNQVGWAEEISLDVLWAHAIAPGANIILDLSKTNDDADILSATKYAVDRNLGDIVSQSFGENESCVDPTIASQEHRVFAEATLKGMTLFASSGDEGAAQTTCDGNSWTKAASSPAADPLVTAVGGTELVAADYCLLAAQSCNPATAPAPGTHLGETAWNEGPPYGDFQDEFDSTLATGGGFSVLFDQPYYQHGLASNHRGPRHHGNDAGRGEPDVSYSAAVLHGVLTYLDIPGIPAGFYRFGGTSAGSPQWAALMAIVNQKAHRHLGFINGALYDVGHSHSKYTQGFFDITQGTNSAVEPDSDGNPVNVDGFDAHKGWDATTGLGSPQASALVGLLIRAWSPFDGIKEIFDSSKFGHGGWHHRSVQRPH
jgi:subtilase family serine protease